MPGCNKCQNICATDVPHNADGEDGKIACHRHHSAVEVCCFIQCPEKIQIYTDVRSAVNPSMLLEAVRAYKAFRLTRAGLLPGTLLGTDTTGETEQKPLSRAPGICTPLPIR